MSLWQKFKNTRFAKFFKRAFKKQDDFTAAEIAALLFLLLFVALAAPALAANKATKKSN